MARNALAHRCGCDVAEEHRTAEDRQRNAHDPLGWLGRPGRLDGGSRQIAVAREGTGNSVLKNRPREEDGFLSVAGKLKPSGDACRGDEWVEGGVGSAFR